MPDVLITAGATRNPIDSMRFISAHSSGETGAIVAMALAEAGADVHLLGSPQALLRAPDGVTTEGFGSTRDLMEKMRVWIADHPRAVVIHAAAVGDYEVEAQPGKIPSGQVALTLHLAQAPKILSQIRTWAPDCYLVSFKAAAPETDLSGLKAITQDQLSRTDSDLVFGNTIGSLGQDVVLTQRHRSAEFSCRKDGIASLLEHLRTVLRD